MRRTFEMDGIRWTVDTAVRVNIAVEAGPNRDFDLDAMPDDAALARMVAGTLDRAGMKVPAGLVTPAEVVDLETAQPSLAEQREPAELKRRRR